MSEVSLPAGWSKCDSCGKFFKGECWKCAKNSSVAIVAEDVPPSPVGWYGWSGTTGSYPLKNDDSSDSGCLNVIGYDDTTKPGEFSIRLIALMKAGLRHLTRLSDMDLTTYYYVGKFGLTLNLPTLVCHLPLLNTTYP